MIKKLQENKKQLNMEASLIRHSFYSEYSFTPSIDLILHMPSLCKIGPGKTL